MAAYAATVTSPMRRPEKIANDNVLWRGSINITNYNSTLVGITGITGKFKTTPNVVLGGLSSNGYLVAWIPGSGSVKAYYGTTNSANAAGTEVAADVDIGSVDFVAIGLG